jgi:hypothetical protein
MSFTQRCSKKWLADDDDCSNWLATTAHINLIGQRSLELSATHLQEESCNVLQTILEREWRRLHC